MMSPTLMPFRTAIRLASLPLGHALLNRDRAFHGVDGARELNQGTVAHQLHDAAVVLGDQWLEALLRSAFTRAIVPASSCPTSRL